MKTNESCPDAFSRIMHVAAIIEKNDQSHVLPDGWIEPVRAACYANDTAALQCYVDGLRAADETANDADAVRGLLIDAISTMLAALRSADMALARYYLAMCVTPCAGSHLFQLKINCITQEIERGHYRAALSAIGQLSSLVDNPFDRGKYLPDGADRDRVKSHLALAAVILENYIPDTNGK